MKYVLLVCACMTVVGCTADGRKNWFRDTFVHSTNARYDCSQKRGAELDDCERKLEQGRSVRR